MPARLGIAATSGLRPFRLRRVLLTALLIAFVIYSAVLSVLQLAESHYVLGVTNAIAAMFWAYITFVLLLRPFSSRRVVLMVTGAWLAVGGGLRILYGAQHSQAPIVATGGLLLGGGLFLDLLVLRMTPRRARLPRHLAEQAATLPPTPRPGHRLASIAFGDGRRVTNALVVGGGYVRFPDGEDLDARDAVEIAPGGETQTVELSGGGLRRSIDSGSLMVTRQPAFVGSQVPFHVMIDGQRVAAVLDGAEVLVHVEPGTHRLRVAMGRFTGSGTAVFEVRATEAVRFACRARWNLVLWPSGWIKLTLLP